MRLLLLASLLAVIGLGNVGGRAEAQDDGEPSGGRLGHERTARIKAVRAEIAELGNHAWAGSYYCGDGLGVNQTLSLAPKNGFTFVWTGCLGIYDYNYGPIEQREDGLLVLKPQLKNEQRGFQGTPTEFYPVSWGKRVYLLPKDDLVRFANFINSGEGQSRNVRGTFFLARLDEGLDVQEGLPEVEGTPDGPKGLTEKLLGQPLVATITPIGERKPQDDLLQRADTPVRIAAGSKQGVFVGMELFPLEGSGLDHVVVTEVGPESSSGVLSQHSFGEELIALDKVQKVSSRSKLFELLNGPATRAGAEEID